MASGIFGISIMGLNAAQANLNTTSQNIANVNTVGYHRQSTDLATVAPATSGNTAVGNGVNVAGVGRAYSSFLDNQVISSQGQLSSYDAYTQYATQLNSLLGNQNSSLSSSISTFFSDVQNVANDPTSVVARQTLLAAGSSLAGQFNSVSSGITDMQQSINQQLQSVTSQVTSYAQGVATLNSQIAAAQASNSSNANALMDQRDQLVAELNKLVNVTVVNQSGSGYNLFIGNGQPLVVGNQANSLTTVVNPADPIQTQPALKIGNSSVPLDSSQITGGQLGGLLSFRDQMLTPTQRELGKVAYTLATDMNNQSNQGFDLNGVQGTNFFTTPAVQDAIANSNNTGNGVVGISLTDPNLLANSDYKLRYDGTNYTLTRLSDGTSYSNTSLANLSTAVSAGEGFSLSLAPSTTINSGDTFLIRPTQYSATGLAVAITDPSKIAAAGAGVTTAATAGNSGTASIGPASLASSVTRPVANVPITLTYSSTAPGTITATDSTSATLGTFTYASGSPMTFNGISVTITGTPANGDSFTLNNSTTTAGPGDNSNALLMANLQNSKLLSRGSSTLQTAFNQIIGGNATLTNAATINQQSYKTLTDQATQAQQSFSGVNLDEEAANLIKYQQAYQAAAKSLQIASSLFSSILTAIQ